MQSFENPLDCDTIVLRALRKQHIDRTQDLSAVPKPIRPHSILPAGFVPILAKAFVPRITRRENVSVHLETAVPAIYAQFAVCGLDNVCGVASLHVGKVRSIEIEGYKLDVILDANQPKVKSDGNGNTVYLYHCEIHGMPPSDTSEEEKRNIIESLAAALAGQAYLRWDNLNWSNMKFG